MIFFEICNFSFAAGLTIYTPGRLVFPVVCFLYLILGGETLDNIDNTITAKSHWLEDERYQTVLRTTRSIAFEYDPSTETQLVSPFVGDYIAGNYDGRMLSNVMLEDGVIYPDDIPKSLKFREDIKSGKTGEMLLRLKNPAGIYTWYKMFLSPHNDHGKHTFVGVLTNMDQEMRQRNLLYYRADFDPVTRIYNQNKFFEAAKEQLEAAPDELHHLIQLDIDRFKIINEMYTIQEGDRVLRYIGAILTETAAPGETYARISNDIFCICLTRGRQETLEFIEQIEKRISAYPLDFQLVLSIGIVSLPHYNKEPINLLCDWAAMAQRKVKGNYIYHYAFYEDQMSKALNWEHYITSCMRKSLDNKEFLIYLQPKYDISTQKIIGAEALVRWQHPDKGLIMPGDFIPLFERNGFILTLDEYIWELVCQTLRRWLDSGLEPVPISVNVSRLHMHDPELCSKIQNLVQKYRLPPRLLELEITESAYTEFQKNLYNVMDYLQESGFVFSMDDFGSGYSSLNVLKDIPVNIVKIDLNFLKEARRGRSIGENVLNGTIQLIRGIGLSIVAEGVETKEQADFLINAGCPYAQGYYFAKPMPVEDFERLWREAQGLSPKAKKDPLENL